ncbi:hypothetical protein [Melghirimyces algeriensis]|uniref:Lipoprotein n=1 Tax=Melghirimyces algeriensis TaxID=910412 RepID=A0A521D1P6_9BACL|nr:hypothetical protein [Melghirimyces algeriensis]SMO65606.1 hypothetical protein SAMN06264849_10562 [Melghirimyces algeriensis]
MQEREVKMDWVGSRTGRVVSLFAMAALLAGCTDQEPETVCRDKDKDGYCDDEVCQDRDEDGYCDDGSGVTGSSYFYKNGKKVFKKVSGAKGGIGRSSGSSRGG